VLGPGDGLKFGYETHKKDGSEDKTNPK